MQTYARACRKLDRQISRQMSGHAHRWTDRKIEGTYTGRRIDMHTGKLADKHDMYT